MGYYIYKHLNLDNEVIYVGLTINIHSRQSEHKSSSSWSDEIHKIEYAEVGDNLLMEIYEKYYISKHLPKYNKKDVDCKYSRFFKNMDELEFKEYVKINKLHSKNKKPSFREVFDEYYLNSIDTINKFKLEYLKTGECDGKYAYVSNNIDCHFYISHSNGFSAYNKLGIFDKSKNKYGYYIHNQGINMDDYNYIKSEEQLKYKSLDTIWEEIFTIK